jgi:hypothetical protein
LDKIGELPLKPQTKLLQVFQDGEFERLGSSRPIQVNVWVIAAINRDLESLDSGKSSWPNVLKQLMCCNAPGASIRALGGRKIYQTYVLQN